jgi:hypothetical protein
MTHVIRAVPTPSRRTAVAVLAAALLGLAALMTTSAGSASAATGSCNSGEFCMWYLTGGTGGLYEFSGSDSNLNDDHFENADESAIVGNNTESVRNFGHSDPNGLVDVVVYDGTGYTGAGLCVKQGGVKTLPTSWFNRIESYKWVTAATCGRYASI